MKWNVSTILKVILITEQINKLTKQINDQFLNTVPQIYKLYNN